MELSKIGDYSDESAFIDAVKQRVYQMEIKCHGCAQVIVQSFLEILEIDNPAVSMAASPFAAGLALTGNNCGAVIGGLMVLGLEFGRRDVNEKMEGILKGIRPMRKFIRRFEHKYGAMNCRDLTKTDLSNPEKADAYFSAGGLENCAAMMADAAGIVAAMLYQANAERTEGQG